MNDVIKSGNIIKKIRDGKNVKYGCCATAFLLRKPSWYLSVLILLMKQRSNLTIESTR